MDHPTTIRLKASVQTLVFVIMLAATLFGSAGRFDIIEFWVYVAIVVAVFGIAEQMKSSSPPSAILSKLGSLPTLPAGSSSA